MGTLKTEGVGGDFGMQLVTRMSHEYFLNKSSNSP